MRPGYTFVGWANASGSEKPDYVANQDYELDPPIVTQIPSGSGDGSMVNKETNPNVVYGVWKTNKVTLVYMSKTEASGEQYVPVRTIKVDLTDRFEWEYDQNKDVDANGNYITENDNLPYRSIGWYDTFYTEMFNGYDYYDPGTPKEVTIQYIADLEFWDGNPDTPIEVYAELEIRMIEVTYFASGFEDDHPFTSVVSYSWFESPVAVDPVWQGNELLEFSDDFGDILDNSMTCGFILKDLLFDPTNDFLTVYINFNALEYFVEFHYPNGFYEEDALTYDASIVLHTDGNGFNYPGYTFVGWFTEDNGGGVQVTDGTTYGALQPDDQETRLPLYAYFIPDAGTSSSPAEGADDIANSTGGNGNAAIMGPAGSDDVTDELPGNVFLVVDDVLSSVRLPQLAGTSTIGVVEASRALAGVEAMVATYVAPVIAVYETAGDAQSSRTGAGNVTTVSRTATNNSYGTNATQTSVLSAITDSILT